MTAPNEPQDHPNPGLRDKVIAQWEREGGTDARVFPNHAGILFEHDRFVIEQFWGSPEGERAARGKMPLNTALLAFLDASPRLMDVRNVIEGMIILPGYKETILEALKERQPTSRRRYRRREG